jgi:hypothetical protein
MATVAPEVELFTGGLDANGASKGRFLQNIFWRNGTMEVRPGFGQIGQVDASLRMPPSQAFSDQIPRPYGPHAILASQSFITLFGHVQIVALVISDGGDTNTSSRAIGSWQPYYALHIFDTTTKRSWEEPLMVQTSQYSDQANPMPYWRGTLESNYDVEWGGYLRASLEGDPSTIPDPADSQGAFMCEFDDSIIFGTPSIGLWCYRPADFLQPAEQAREASYRLEYHNRKSESACVFKITPTSGAFRANYAYLDAAGFPTPVDACSFNGSLAIADQQAIYFSDPGRPNCIIGLNILAVAPDNPITAITEVNGQLLIWSATETYLFTPGNGLPSEGTLVKVSNNVGCIGARAKTKVGGGVAWCGYTGVFSSNGSIGIKEMSAGILPLFNFQISNPWSSFSVANGATALAGDQPRSFYDLTDTRGINMALDPNNDLLFLSVPAHRGVWILQGGNWSFWSMESMVNPNGDVQTTHNMVNLQICTANGQVFAVGGAEEYVPDDKTVKGRTSSPVNDPTRSLYFLEWQHGGGIDRTVDATEDNRRFAGWYEASGSIPTNVDDKPIFWIGRPVILPAAYTGLVSPNAAVSDSQPAFMVPIYLSPAKTGLISPATERLFLSFEFDSSHWVPITYGATAEVAFVLPPERTPAYEGFGMHAPAAGVAEVQVYDAGGLPNANGLNVRIRFDGTVGAGTWACKPTLNLNPRFLNPIIYIPFRRKSGITLTDTVMSMGITINSATTTSHGGAAVGAATFIWHEPQVQNRHDDDDTAQPIDWCFKSEQIGEGQGAQVKARGLYLRVVQHGKGVNNDFISWPWGLLNATVGSDWKDWSSQIIDYSNGAVKVDTKDPALRSRFRDSSGSTVVSQRIFDSTDSTPPAWGDSGDSDVGNFLIDDEQFDTVAISDDVRGEFVSWMLFGHVRDRAERLAFHSCKAAMRQVAGRRRGGR